MKIRYLLVAGAALATAAAVAPGAVGAVESTGAQTPTPTVVMSGLNNPRQLALVGQHTLFVAEAGKGGPNQVGEGDEAQYVGDTGSISRIDAPATSSDLQPNRVVEGLLSAASQTGEFAVGSDGVAARKVQGPVYVAETYAPPDIIPSGVQGEQAGKLLAVRPGQTKVKSIADISGYEIANDPDMKGVETNPYGVLAVADGELVADAAGNDVVHVDRAGDLSTFHVFPNVRKGDCKGQKDPGPGYPGCNFVPTSLAMDRRGDVWVGGLASEVPGAGQVVELSPDGSTVLRVIHNFTSVTGVAVADNGDVYVSELEGQEANPPADGVVGTLTRVPARGHRSSVDVPFPAGVAVDRGGNVYVAAWSVASEDGFFGQPITGQVWRLHF